jgi:hypothetical protein
VDLPAVLTAFDEQMRRRPVAGPGARVEVDERVTRTVGTDASWSAVVWSDLTEANADEVIAAEVARSTGALEWKLYSHDRPADLPDRLKAAGLQPEPVETLMVAEIADLDLPVAEPAGVRLVGVDDAQGVESMLGVHEKVFGSGSVHPGTVEAVRTALGLRPRPIEAVVAWAGDVAVSAGRVEFHEGTEFVGRRNAPDLARPRSLPRAGGAPRPPGPRAGFPLPAGRRVACEPADPAADGFPPTRRDDPVDVRGLTGSGSGP